MQTGQAAYPMWLVLNIKIYLNNEKCLLPSALGAGDPHSYFRHIIAAASMAALKHNSSGGAFRPFTSGYSLLIPRPSVRLLVFCAVVSLAGSSVSVAGLPSSSAVRQWVARSFPLGYWQRAGFPPII